MTNITLSILDIDRYSGWALLHYSRCIFISFLRVLQLALSYALPMSWAHVFLSCVRAVTRTDLLTIDGEFNITNTNTSTKDAMVPSLIENVSHSCNVLRKGQLYLRLIILDLKSRLSLSSFLCRSPLYRSCTSPGFDMRILFPHWELGAIA